MLDAVPFAHSTHTPHQATHFRPLNARKKAYFWFAKKKKNEPLTAQHISRSCKMPNEDGAHIFGMRECRVRQRVRFWALIADAAPYILEKIPSRSLNIFTAKLNNIRCAFYRARLLLFYDAIKITFEILALVVQRDSIAQRTPKPITKAKHHTKRAAIFPFHSVLLVSKMPVESIRPTKNENAHKGSKKLWKKIDRNDRT